ncbi:peptidase, M43 family [Formosa sp. Hel1_33_131]|uniref:T9SS type A sorting domain-containing protein n=1 Tax=Formosa sp. Hel1_33_131 TaxID=1336794 RepID=UPI00084E0F15|nr:T9SS type A sorting domain-containing protein [Formosa sp. Hel1_33_131]AOR27873.1 peptidase, M43 family [Formosa sp. Hel1_33_131]
MKKITLKVILMALMSTTAISFAQTSTNTQTLFGQELTDANIKSLDESGVIRCASVEYEQYLKALYPERATNAEFESWLAPKVEAVKAQRSNGVSIITTLPVVFHILTDEVGNENLSEAVIQAQIDQLNLDFGNGAGSSYTVATDTEVRFCLAQQNETEVTMFEPGINRITDYDDGPFSMSDFENTIKPATQWDPTRYLNIWLANLESPLLGYAQFPVSSGLSGLNFPPEPANTDGVVILSSSVGSVASPNPLGGSYGLGRTLTHELGHWFGLRHIWGDSGNCSNDDFCADTPDATTSNGGCPTVDSCPSDGLGADMVENYMDYTNDACMDTFTADQKTRIQAVLANSPRRMELGASTVCSPAIVYEIDGAIELDNLNLVDCATTFAPTVVVTNNGTTTLTSAVISYAIDEDTAATQSWSGFLFQNQSDTVTLPTMNVSGGSHTLVVELLSPNGFTDENTVDNTVVSTAFTVFVDTATVNLTLLTDEYGDETSWDFKDSNDTILYSGEINVYGNETTYNHTFDVPTGGCYSFTIYDSEGDGICCGWGAGSYTLTDSNSNVIATGGEFGAQESVSFTTVNTLGTENYLLDRKITLYPNPATNVLYIKVGASNSLPDTYKVYNMLGQIVLQQSIGELNDLAVNTSSLSKGMYFIKIATDNASISLPFIKN